MDIEYKEVTDLEQAYKIMSELRTKLTLEDFMSIYQQAKSADQYTLLGAYLNSECVALMGYRFLFDYVHGKHLYIDDLVTTQSHRSKGVGAQLLKEAEGIAGQSGCAYLRLSTGVENDGGKNFYEREGLTLRAVVYKKNLSVN